MDEEKRIVTIYASIDYDEPLEKFKEALKKFDASLVAANEDEWQVKIAKSKLEDFCNEFDLDIDDMTEEWDSYQPVEEEQAEEQKNDIAVYVGRVDKPIEDFDSNEFLEKARQNKNSVDVRLQKDQSSVYELYVDFEDKAYIELWKIDIKHDPEDEHCDSELIYSSDFDENDMAEWEKAKEAIASIFDKKKEKSHAKHQLHHQQTDSFPRPGFSAEAAMLLDEAEEAESLDEINYVSYLASAALQSGDIDKQEYANIMRIIDYKESHINDSCKDACKDKCKDVCKDAYEYDMKLAEQIRDEILEGANADVPQNIDYAISSRGGKVESMRIAPDSIHVIWHLKDFTADNRIYLNALDAGVKLLAEDIAHAIWNSEKKAALHDSTNEQHKIAITPDNVKAIADLCDKFDEAGIKYRLETDNLVVHCGPQQWNALKARFKTLQGE